MGQSSKFAWMPAIPKMGPLHQIKGDLNLFFLKLSLHGFALYLHRIHSGIVPINCVNLKQIHAGKVLKKIDLNLLLFDVGGPHDVITADDASRRNFKLHDLFCNL